MGEEVIDSQVRKDILSRGKPEPRDVPWWDEPNLGAWYTEAEVDATVSAIRESNDWTVGLGVKGKVKVIEEMLGLETADLSREDFYSYENKFKGPF